MSFLDSTFDFMDNLDCSGAVAAQSASKYLDLETSDEDDATTIIGEIDKQLGTVYWNTMVGAAATAAGDDTSIKLITSDAKTFTNPEILASIGDTADPLTYAGGDLALGTCWSIQIPTKKCLRFLGVEKVGTGATSLKLDSWLGMESIQEQNIQKYPT